MSYKSTVEGRLVARLVVDNKNGCWLWTGPTNAGGYGKMGIAIPGRARRIALVHRVAAWLWLDVELDGPHEICHGCDVKRCCNPHPGHVAIGNRSQNQKEAWARGLNKGTTGKGRKGKLTARKATAIRKLYATGNYSQRALAERAGVSQVMISRVLRNRNWND